MKAATETNGSCCSTAILGYIQWTIKRSITQESRLSCLFPPAEVHQASQVCSWQSGHLNEQNGMGGGGCTERALLAALFFQERLDISLFWNKVFKLLLFGIE